MSNEDIVRKQNASQAMPGHPAFLNDLYKEKEEPKVKKGTAEKLIQGSESEFWTILKGFINRRREQLEQMTRESVRKDGFDLANTGFRYLIFDQVDAFAKDLISYVENPARLKVMQEEREKSTSNK